MFGKYVRVQPPVKQGCKHLLTGDEGGVWPLTEPYLMDSFWNIPWLWFDDLFEREIKSLLTYCSLRIKINLILLLCSHRVCVP